MMEPVHTELPTLSQYHILIAEDEPFARSLLETYLVNWGLTVTTAADGQEAYQKLLQDEDIRLLITDLNMPGMDGIELLQNIQQTGRAKLYSVVLSGISDRRTLIRALAAGANDYLIKPCHPEQIFSRLAILDKVIALENSYQTQVDDLFEVMGQMLGSRDAYTLEHSRRVTVLSDRIAQLMDLPTEERRVLQIGCAIHDIGKIAIPDDILLKPGKFNEFDRRIMNLHPSLGANLIANRYQDDRVTELILQHHERLDGSGYPLGLKGEEIGILPRIVMVADIFEALVATRPYKMPLPQETAIKILRSEAAMGKIDGNIVDKLEKVVEKLDILSIKCPLHYQDLQTIESFRQIAYFREPFCNFYNYRYLITLANKQKNLTVLRKNYHMILLDFKNLSSMNKRLGYIQTDTLIDQFGEMVLEEISHFKNSIYEIEGDILLLRKGADYILFSNHDTSIMAHLSEIIKQNIQTMENLWSADISLKTMTFDSSLPIENAINQLIAS